MVFYGCAIRLLLLNLSRNRTHTQARAVQIPSPPFSGVEEISSQLITELNLTRGKFNACIKRAES
jgi:hypothetical protein